MSEVTLPFAEQPVLRFGVTSRLARCEIRINDVPVYRDTRGRAIAFDMPINEWLFQNENAVEVVLRAAPAEGQDPEKADDSPLAPRASFALVIRHKRNRAPLRSLTDLAAIRYLHSEDGKHLFPPSLVAPPAPAPAPEDADEDEDQEDEEEESDDDRDDAPRRPPPPPAAPPPGAWSFASRGIAAESTTHRVVLRAGLTLPANWPACPWRDALPLPAPDATRYALRQLTAGIHAILARRDLAALDKTLAFRHRRIADAYHLGGADLADLTGLRDRLRDPRCTVAPVPDELTAIPGAGNRTARLVDTATGLPPLRLCLPDSADLALDLLWAMVPGWTVVG